MIRCKTDDRLVDCVCCEHRKPHESGDGTPECYRPVEWTESVMVCGGCKWRRGGECGKTGGPAPSPLWAGCPMMEVR